MSNPLISQIDHLLSGRDLVQSNPLTTAHQGKGTRSLFSRCAAAALGLAAAALSMNAQTPASQVVPDLTTATQTRHTEPVANLAVQQFWTPQRILNAKAPPVTLRVAADGKPLVADTEAAFRGAAQKSAGGLPDPQAAQNLQKTLVSPADFATFAETDEADALSEVPEASSPFGARFTTSRVFPDAASAAFPYRTAGKLYFHDPRTSFNYVCSASVLRPRIIMTAGHCVTHPSTSPYYRYFYTNFMFVPAYNNGSAPFGVWTPSAEWIINTWYYSDGSVPNAQDIGMLVARDGRTKLGYTTGWLGYFTNQLGNNNVTMLGYPCNLDSCLKMEENFAQTYEYGGNNTYIYGSAMKGGSSGGPWIQDFGVNPSGAPSGLLANNYLVGVTSYGPTNTALMFSGASNLDNDFLSLLSSACGAASTGNCQ